MVEPIGAGAGLDARLRDALARAARPGDSAGVADAIRSRLDAGDSGTSVATATAPGWGGGAWSWMPWLGLVVVAGVVGTALGVSGVAGRPAGETVVDVPVALGESAAAYDCIGGARIGRLSAGTRVLAVERSDDALWLGVRDPRALGSTVWVALGDVSLDEGRPALDALPVGGACPETVVVVEAEPAPEPTQGPDPGPNPAPNPNPDPGPSDTTAPTASGPSADVNNCPAIVRVSAGDNVAVTGVTVSWSGAASGSAQMTPAGGALWQLSYDSANLPEGNMTFTFVARDAAGNQSPPVAINVYMVCLI